MLFWCPGCGEPHPFDLTRWQWNGDLKKPTFTPSLLCNKDNPLIRCHLFVTDGKITYCGDCHPELKNQTVDMVEWDSEEHFR